jgi:hypothetical protein
MDVFNDVNITNYCLTILANGKKLPNYAYYNYGDDVKTMFWDELSSKDLTKIHRHCIRKNKRNNKP